LSLFYGDLSAGAHLLERQNLVLPQTAGKQVFSVAAVRPGQSVWTIQYSTSATERFGSDTVLHLASTSNFVTFNSVYNGTAEPGVGGGKFSYLNNRLLILAGDDQGNLVVKDIFGLTREVVNGFIAPVGGVSVGANLVQYGSFIYLVSTSPADGLRIHDNIPAEFDDRYRFVVGCDDPEFARFFDSALGTPATTDLSFNQKPTVSAITSDGQRLAVYDSRIILYKIVLGVGETSPLVIVADHVTALAFSQDGRFLYIGRSVAPYIRVYDVIREIEVPAPIVSAAVTSFDISSTGLILAVGINSVAGVALFSTADLSVISFPLHGAAGTFVKFVLDDQLLVVGDGILSTVYRTADWTTVKKAVLPPGPVTAITETPDQEYLIVATDTETKAIRMLDWSVDTTMPSFSGVTSAQLVNSGRWLFLTGSFAEGYIVLNTSNFGVEQSGSAITGVTTGFAYRIE
jgi:hypothetical protein